MNGEVIILSDRNIGPSTAPKEVQNIWTTTPGDDRVGFCVDEDP